MNPPGGFDVTTGLVEDLGYQAPAANGSNIEVGDPGSSRLQLLTPFDPWNNKNYIGMRLLIKLKVSAQLTIYQWQDHG